MDKKKLLVTGSNGQLGSEIKALAQKYPTFDFVFTNSKILDITNASTVTNFFKENKFDYCINCAAYTQVDKAEKEQEHAFAVNVVGVKNLIENCKKNNTILIHISTDFVFDGTKNEPYTEEDTPNPINYYGKTKYLGELAVQKELISYFIIRTSWLYGKNGANFVKTMLRLAQENKALKIVNNQFGTPTNAADLATFILYLIKTNTKNFGIYHFSNSSNEKTSWFDFAKEILKNINIKVKGIPSEAYPTPAKRPFNSTMDLVKVKNLNFDTRTWKEALANYMK
jgi:dTDP-4-dehydrorhamnose reductase